MITEKQKEAVKELCQYVDNFCKENNLSAFMSVAASEDHPDGLEQIAGSIITGKGEYVVGAISGTVKADSRFICCFPWHSCRPTRERLTLILFRSVKI